MEYKRRHLWFCCTDMDPFRKAVNEGNAKSAEASFSVTIP